MRKELKIRLANPQTAIDKIKSLGATYLHDATYEYTYFNQPEGKVLKLTKKDGKTNKTVIEREADRFVIKSSDELTSPKEVADELTAQYGLKRHLVNHRSFYEYDNYELSINDIEGLGIFLIVEGEDPQLDFVTNTLEIEEPEVIKVSFDNL